MSSKDLRDRRDLGKLKTSSFFDKETSPKVRKKIKPIIEKLDKEIVENKKVIAEIDRVILDTMSYEELKKQANLIRLRVGFDLL